MNIRVFSYESVDPSTGVYETVGSIVGGNVASGVTCYDENNKLFWFQLTSYTSIVLYGMDVKTGEIKHSIDNTEHEIATLDYDPPTGKLYGIGLDDLARRTLLTFDPISGHVDILGWKLRNFLNLLLR
jgi:hypothetical protein